MSCSDGTLRQEAMKRCDETRVKRAPAATTTTMTTTTTTRWTRGAGGRAKGGVVCERNPQCHPPCDSMMGSTGHRTNVKDPEPAGDRHNEGKGGTSTMSDKDGGEGVGLERGEREEYRDRPGWTEGTKGKRVGPIKSVSHHEARS